VKSFVDEAQIEVRSGDGGSGAVSFRREKYVPRGGPDGGDGGKGGDVVFVVRGNLKTLSHLRKRRIYRAGDGNPGGPRQKHGRDGTDATIYVPPGTIIRDSTSGAIMKDLTDRDQMWVCLKGGKGGGGNRNFATSVRRAPKFAKPGGNGETRTLQIELNLIADIGLVGLPNSGKSTLLSRLTNARPAIADYPFTTTAPNLGVLNLFDREIIIADIPGILEGASTGVGLGLRFLKHIARTRLLAFVIDLAEEHFSETPRKLFGELASYDRDLQAKRRILIGNKIDLLATKVRVEELKREYSTETVFGVSALEGIGLGDLKRGFADLLKMDSVE
jgi:GTP-binding protein